MIVKNYEKNKNYGAHSNNLVKLCFFNFYFCLWVFLFLIKKHL